MLKAEGTLPVCLSRDWKHIPGCDATGNFSSKINEGGWSNLGLAEILYKPILIHRIRRGS